MSLIFVGWKIINKKPAYQETNAVNSDKKAYSDVQSHDSTSPDKEQHGHKRPARDDKKGCVVHL